MLKPWHHVAVLAEDPLGSTFWHQLHRFRRIALGSGKMQLAIADAGISGRSPKRAAQSPDASDESVQTNGNTRKSRKMSFATSDLCPSEASTPTGSEEKTGKGGGASPGSEEKLATTQKQANVVANRKKQTRRVLHLRGRRAYTHRRKRGS